MKFKTVYFDLGNVLVYFSFPQMIEQLSKCSGISKENIHKHLIDGGLRELYEKGKITTQQIYEILLKESPKQFSLDTFTHAFADIFTPNRDVWPVVEELKKKGVRLILLSNTSECHFNFISANYPILKLFDSFVLSYKVGAWKPDPEIFEYALKQSQCEPADCFYTDDIPEYIVTARKLGLQGEVFTDAVSLKKHFDLN